MLRIGRYVFKIADQPREFEQIHRLNFQTFVTEIPQHHDPGTGGLLVDKFHDKSTYFIAQKDDRLVGMISTHDQPPFSVASRMPDPSLLSRPDCKPLECRLLAIVPEERHTVTFAGLIWSIHLHVTEKGYSHLYISGVEDRVRLYEQIGFEALGPAVPDGDARFVPMIVTPARIAERIGRPIQLWRKRLERQDAGPRPVAPICLLPGPVTIAPAVTAAFRRPPIYHRGAEFIARFERVRRLLGDLVGGRDVALFTGSGTLANEAVAATLAAGRHPGRGLLLTNGEFGDRLVHQARRFGLEPQVLTWPWGQPWDLDEVRACVAKEPAGSWGWGVHLETSTGVLNPLPELIHLARERGLHVCVDCVSSLGAVPLDLSGVYLASGSTGKALGSYAGIAVVFANAAALEPLDRTRIPSYLDVPAALNSIGPLYTFPSPVLAALETALSEYATSEKARDRYAAYSTLGRRMREHLRDAGMPPLASEGWAAPVIATFVPPGTESSEAFVSRCRDHGFEIGGESHYLSQRRLVQIATMGLITAVDLDAFFGQLKLQAGVRA